MSFVYTWFLWALAAIAIPIIIHLFYFRRFKTVYFTNVRFLKEVKEQTASRSKIKHLLVLIMRILAVAFLALAFAIPFLPNKDGQLQAGSKDVSIFFDNSFSMSAESQDVRLLEKARRRAEEIISAYDNEDRIQIITSDAEGRDQRLLSKEDALSRVREVRVTYQVKELSKIIARQQQTLKTGDNKSKEIYIISDFQKNITDLTRYEDSTTQLTLIPLQSVQNRNVSIDSAWFQSPVQTLNQANELMIKVHNWSDVEISNVRLVLTIDGEERPVGTLNIPAKSSVTDTVNVTVTKTGWHEAKLNITDFPIEFDNDYFFTFHVAEKVEILEIFETAANRNIQAAFQNNGYFVWSGKSVNQLDYSKLSQYNLLVLSELRSIPSGLANELYNYVNSGGNLVVFPHPQADLTSYNALCQQLNVNSYGTLEAQERAVNYINFQEFVFNDVFEERRDNMKLPTSQRNFKIAKRATTGEEVLLRYRDGATFVGKYTVDKGTVYLSAVPLGTDFSDLVQNGEIFVPMLFRMAMATGKERKIAYTIGKDQNMEADNRNPLTGNELVYKLSGRGGEFIPQQKVIGSRIILGVQQQIPEAGIYALFLNPEQVVEKFAFNYDRKESELAFFNKEELKAKVGDLANIVEGDYTSDFADVIATQQNGVALWKWCLIVTLIALLLETLILRFWRV